jgi:hypothetical protein
VERGKEIRDEDPHQKRARSVSADIATDAWRGFARARSSPAHPLTTMRASIDTLLRRDDVGRF